MLLFVFALLFVSFPAVEVLPRLHSINRDITNLWVKRFGLSEHFGRTRNRPVSRYVHHVRAQRVHSYCTRNAAIVPVETCLLEFRRVLVSRSLLCLFARSVRFLFALILGRDARCTCISNVHIANVSENVCTDYGEDDRREIIARTTRRH